MSEYIDTLGSEIIIKARDVERFIVAMTGEAAPEGREAQIETLDNLFNGYDCEHTQTTTDKNGDVIHCYQWVCEEGIFRGHHEEFFEDIAPFVTGHVDYLSNGTPYRFLFENGKLSIETGEVRFPSSDRW